MDDRERHIASIVKAALAEDAARKDLTTRLLIEPARVGDAVIRARTAGVVSGHDAAREAFRALDPGIAYSPAAPNGGRVERDAAVARVYGRVRAIIAAERTALNFLARLSGVATLTAAFASALAGTGVVLLDTRKTTPGLRMLEKEAVVHGGGRNHRSSLAEAILVKDNHIAAAGGVAAVAQKLGAAKFAQAEIEVGSIAELRSLRESPPGRIMLDNFEPAAAAEAVAEVSAWPIKPEIEISGGVTLENAAAFAIPGVAFISVGSLTSRAVALDMSLELEGVDGR